MILKNHLDMIGRNEPIQHKARFWQSYVRALKGTDDMRAPDRVSSRPRGIFRPLLSSEFPELSTWPTSKSIYDDPIHAVDRISVPGYRYLPVSRETYGYSPRNIYPHQYHSTDRYRPDKVVDPIQVWKDHQQRLADIEKQYPSRWPLILRYHTPGPYVPRRIPPSDLLSKTLEPNEKPFAFNYAGQPIYTRGGLTRRPLIELLQPSTHTPLSMITRDPWWWSYPELRPFDSPYAWPRYPYFLRNSFLSPIKRKYLWGTHPIRPFAHVY